MAGDKLWAGRFSKQTDALANDFNASIGVDCRMAKQDITGSMAHATMLAARGIISQADRDVIVATLEDILSDLESGALQIDMTCEDIHTFVEGELTKRVGDVGKRLHTARSRNDQVALDLRLYLRDEIAELQQLTEALLGTLCDLAEKHADTVMPGYTHLQRAQPVTLGQHFMAWAAMLLRDRERLTQTAARTNISPLGSCALAGTTFDTDRRLTAQLLGMNGISFNSMDGVSDRDFAVELAGVLSLAMMHLSRMAEEIVLWSSFEFRFIELDDGYSTGSSIMPQKKNPDMAELVRGKTGRVYGDLITLLTMLKGLPLAYNKDMQEDKEAVFDAVDTVKLCLSVMTPMLQTMTVQTANLRHAAASGFINATDCADYLVRKGLPFRSAYKAVGELVAECIGRQTTLEELPLEVYQQKCDLFEQDVYDAIGLETCVKTRISEGGTCPESVRKQVQLVRSLLN